jgi:hypothetical protein
MLFDYFQERQIGCPDLTFQINYTRGMPDPSTCNMKPDVVINVVDEIHEPSDATDEANRFVLVAANKQPGPGPTGTQEERVQATSPWLVLASLLCPSIPDDAAVIVSYLPLLGSWTGHNRSANLKHLYERDQRPLRRYILADALPLDDLDEEGYVGTPDLRPGVTERELQKLYAAFSGALNAAREAQQLRCIIESPPWGCGAFGGDFLVKMQVMMVAAGLAGVSVVLSVTADRQGDVAQLRDIQSRYSTASDLWDNLLSQRSPC